jgi:hypothetical protein
MPEEAVVAEAVAVAAADEAEGAAEDEAEVAAADEAEVAADRMRMMIIERGAQSYR